MRLRLSWVFLGLLAAPLALALADTKPAVVFTSTLKRVELFEQLSYPGRVISKVNTTVLSEADGVVSKIYAPLGKTVRRREKVVQIAHTDPVYQYAPVTL